jgi:hypothetical protein
LAPAGLEPITLRVLGLWEHGTYRPDSGADVTMNQVAIEEAAKAKKDGARMRRGQVILGRAGGTWDSSLARSRRLVI